MIEPVYIYRAKFTDDCDAHDGDTFDLMVDLGFRSYSRLRIRLHGYDAVELRSPLGREAMEFTKSILSVAANAIVVQSYKDAHSFERWVCDVWINGRHLGELLDEAGYLKKP